MHVHGTSVELYRQWRRKVLGENPVSATLSTKKKKSIWNGLSPNTGLWMAVRLQIMLRKWTPVGYTKHIAGYAAVRRVRKGTTNGQNSGNIGRSLWQQGKFVLLQHFLNSPGGTRKKYKDSFKTKYSVKVKTSLRAMPSHQKLLAADSLWQMLWLLIDFTLYCLLKCVLLALYLHTVSFL